MGMCGIIFDLDGVLCYTDHYHYLAWKALADSWNTVSVPVELVSGQNTITISYQAGNFAGINLDCSSLRKQ